MRAPIAFAFMLLSGAILAPGAWSQDAGVMKVLACLDIKDSAARLACFDATTPLMRPGPQPSPPGLGFVTRPPAPAAAPSASLVPAETPDKITLGISAIDAGADGKLRFVLSNGETWRQTDSVAVKNLGKGPWTAELRKAALGSFMLKIGNKTPVRVQRVE